MLATDVNGCPSVEQSVIPDSDSGKRFTLDGDDSLEAHLTTICASVSHGVRQIVPPRRLEALLLGGGYGRGEGGVLKTSSGDRPYNDLEFYVFISGNRLLNRRRFVPPLNRLVHELNELAQVELEFHIIPSAQLRKSEPSMFYYDLVAGHRLLWGEPDVLRGCDHHRDPKQLPLAEATRLLMNRGTGLLLAREKLSGALITREDRDFIARNIAKAQLALGDAVLTACGEYHWSCRERNRRLSALGQCVSQQTWFDLVRRHHDSGVQFKLHPNRSAASVTELRLQHESITDLMLRLWLWVERQRLQTEFSSARQYATSALNKCPETNSWRNQLLNAWTFGPKTLMSATGRRHPRERVFNALSTLLWEKENPAGLAGDLLKTDASSLDAYKRLWERVR